MTRAFKMMLPKSLMAQRFLHVSTGISIKTTNYYSVTNIQKLKTHHLMYQANQTFTFPIQVFISPVPPIRQQLS